MTAAVAIAALALQLGLVVSGEAVLVEEDPPGLGARLARFVSYFTIQSNVLVAVGTTWLARDPAADGRWLRAVRLAGTVGITVTGLVHFVLLRPLLHLEGLSMVCDKLLHVVVPVLAVVGWAWFGPRGRVDRGAIAVAFAWPLAWLAWTLAAGSVTGWVPYPFLDADTEGWPAVLATSAGVTALFVALFALLAFADRRLAVTATAARPPGADRP